MSFYLKNNQEDFGSYILPSFQKLEESIGLEQHMYEHGKLYGHSVIIKTENITIKNSELDCEFDIPFDDDTEANEAQLIIYNLSNNTIQNIKKGSSITVEAGYQEDTGVIFAGFIAKVKTYYSGQDKITEIYALDSMNLSEREVESIIYANNTKASNILKDLISRVGLPVAVFNIVRDYTYKDGITVDGGLMEMIRKMAQVCGVSAYICKSQIYVRPLSEGDSLEFQLSNDTGLLELSEFEEEETVEDYTDTIKGYEVTMLLQHRVTTASILNIKTKNISGLYRVKEGTHSYNGEDFLTKVKAIERMI